MMAANDHVALREFIEAIIDRDNHRRDGQRTDDMRRIDERFEALDKALKLQAAAYPTTRDFNDLKTHVDVELASRSGSSNAVTTLFQVLTVLSMIFNAVLGYLFYFKH